MKIEWKLRQNTTTTLLITSMINEEIWPHVSFNTPVMMVWGYGAIHSKTTCYTLSKRIKVKEIW